MRRWVQLALFKQYTMAKVICHMGVFPFWSVLLLGRGWFRVFLPMTNWLQYKYTRKKLQHILGWSLVWDLATSSNWPIFTEESSLVRAARRNMSNEKKLNFLLKFRLGDFCWKILFDFVRPSCKQILIVQGQFFELIGKEWQRRVGNCKSEHAFGSPGNKWDQIPTLFWVSGEQNWNICYNVVDVERLRITNAQWKMNYSWPNLCQDHRSRC